MCFLNWTNCRVVREGEASTEMEMGINPIFNQKKGIMRMKHFVTLLTASLVLATSSSFADDTKLPERWFVAGSHPQAYSFGTDASIVHKGKFSCRIKSKITPINGFGTLMQTFSATRFLDKRIRMSAFVKADKIEGWSGLWLRIDGEGQEEFNLSFDNMKTRPIKGTIDWKKYEVVLDVPSNGKTISFGLLLGGTGQAWCDDFKFEVVAKDVPLTGQTKENLPPEPKNLGFK